MTVARSLAPLVFASAGLVLSGIAFAQPTRVPTVTRLVKQFAELEARIDDAVVAADRGALDALLTDDFELRVGPGPGTPVARAEWLDAIAKHRNGPTRGEQFAVHDEGTVAIVSFRQTPSGSNATPLFVVDVWRRNGDDWRLAIRYAASAAKTAIPGADPARPAVPKKY